MILEIALAALVSCDPRLTAIFTPIRSQAGRYDVCTTSRPLAEVTAAAASESITVSAPETIDALDAFGSAGPYDRGALNRLYDGRRVRVARGWRQNGGRFESLAFISPFPDADLSKLNSGTLIIRLTLDRSGR